MFKTFLGFFKRNYLFFLGLILVSLLFWPLFYAPYFSHHDDVQVIRLHEMNECFSDFQIPCRWDPNLGGLMGYPLFNYYGPLPYYFGELVYIISGSFIFSAKTMFALSFLGSYVFMYLLGRKLWGDKGGFLSALFYAYAPYHALDFYVRGAMGEMWALMFFPAVIWSVLRIKDNINHRNAGLIGIFFALLVMSHNLSAMIFLPVVLGFILLLYFSTKNLKIVTYSLVGIVFGLLISAFYWLPSLGEKHLVHVETTISGYFSYTEHFKGLKKLFLERMWGWGASVREIPGGERDGMSFQIGVVHLFAWIVAGVLAFFNRKKTFVLIVFLFCTFGILISVFMIHPRSQFVWNILPPLAYLQFPWRLLMFVTFFISITVGSIAFYINKKIVTVILIILTFLVVTFNFSYFVPEKFFYVNDSEYLSGSNWDKQIKRSIFDYLPKSAKFPPAELATVRYEILDGEPNISEFVEGSNWMKFNVVTETPSKIRLSQYYFPNWKVKIDNTHVPIEYNNDLGLITFVIPPGKHSVEAKLYDTPLRTISNIISLVSLLGLLIIFKKK